MGKIDTLECYIELDTLTDSSGTYQVGYRIIQPDHPYHLLPVRVWRKYSKNGCMLSEGQYSIGFITLCTAFEKRPMYYVYKSGYWTFWYYNGQKMAQGSYQIQKREYPAGCKSPIYYYYPSLGETWKFWNEINEPSSITPLIKSFVDEQSVSHIPLTD